MKRAGRGRKRERAVRVGFDYGGLLVALWEAGIRGIVWRERDGQR